MSEEIERALADFRTWFALAPLTHAAPPETGSSAAEPIDVSTLAGLFVALRQEVNLQTKAVRAQQEQSGEAVRLLQQALEALERSRQSAKQEAQQSEDEKLRPLLKALADVYDALAVAAPEIRKLQGALLDDVEDLLTLAEEPEPDPEVDLDFFGVPVSAPGRSSQGSPSPRTLWTRWFGRGGQQPEDPAAEVERAHREAAEARRSAWLARLEAHREIQRRAREERARRVAEVCERLRQALSTLVQGYTMSLQRIDRTLRQHGLEPIPTVGQPFDPERMEVLEVVAGTGRASGEVIEEVRRGYLRNGRVFRFAQVRVARD